MQTYLMNGRLSMKSNKKLNLDSYFDFLAEFFKTFDFKKIKRKKIKGDNFKL